MKRLLSEFKRQHYSGIKGRYSLVHRLRVYSIIAYGLCLELDYKYIATVLRQYVEEALNRLKVLDGLRTPYHTILVTLTKSKVNLRKPTIILGYPDPSELPKEEKLEIIVRGLARVLELDKLYHYFSNLVRVLCRIVGFSRKRIEQFFLALPPDRLLAVELPYWLSYILLYDLKTNSNFDIVTFMEDIKTFKNEKEWVIFRGKVLLHDSRGDAARYEFRVRAQLLLDLLLLYRSTSDSSYNLTPIGNHFLTLNAQMYETKRCLNANDLIQLAFLTYMPVLTILLLLDIYTLTLQSTASISQFIEFVSSLYDSHVDKDLMLKLGLRLRLPSNLKEFFNTVSNLGVARVRILRGDLPGRIVNIELNYDKIAELLIGKVC